MNWNNGEAPIFTEPSPGYHGSRFWDTAGPDGVLGVNVAFIMQVPRGGLARRSSTSQEEVQVVQLPPRPGDAQPAHGASLRQHPGARQVPRRGHLRPTFALARHASPRIRAGSRVLPRELPRAVLVGSASRAASGRHQVHRLGQARVPARQRGRRQDAGHPRARPPRTSSSPRRSRRRRGCRRAAPRSVGIEHIDDICADFAQALEGARTRRERREEFRAGGSARSRETGRWTCDVSCARGPTVICKSLFRAPARQGRISPPLASSTPLRPRGASPSYTLAGFGSREASSSSSYGLYRRRRSPIAARLACLRACVLLTHAPTDARRGERRGSAARREAPLKRRLSRAASRASSRRRWLPAYLPSLNDSSTHFGSGPTSRHSVSDPRSRTWRAGRGVERLRLILPAARAVSVRHVGHLGFLQRARLVRGRRRRVRFLVFGYQKTHPPSPPTCPSPQLARRTSLHTDGLSSSIDGRVSRGSSRSLCRVASWRGCSTQLAALHGSSAALRRRDAASAVRGPGVAVQADAVGSG